MKTNSIVRLNIRSLVAIVSIIIFSSLVNSASLVFAQQDQGGGSGLSISPTRNELTIIPGLKDTATVSVKNITSGTVIAEMFVDDFAPDNETGEPRLVVDESIQNAASIKSFVTGLKDVELEPGDSEEITVTIEVPENAAPGGYYGALRFRAVPKNIAETSSDYQVSLTANVLSLLLVDVPGDVEQKVAVNFISAYLDDRKGSLFTKVPNFIGAEVDNLGNGFVKPFGRVTVTNMFNKEVFNYEINDSNPRGNVLPNSKRLFKDRLVNVEKTYVNDQEIVNESSPIKWPGRYKLETAISYGTGGVVLSVSSTFWYIPTWLIAVMIVLVLLLVGLIYYLYKKYITKSTRRR